MNFSNSSGTFKFSEQDLVEKGKGAGRKRVKYDARKQQTTYTEMKGQSNRERSGRLTALLTKITTRLLQIATRKKEKRGTGKQEDENVGDDQKPT